MPHRPVESCRAVRRLNLSQEEVGERDILPVAPHRSCRSSPCGSGPTVEQIGSDILPSHIDLSSVPEEGFAVHLTISPITRYELRQGDRRILTRDYPAGATIFFDTRQPAIIHIPAAHRLLHFYMPGAVLKNCARRRRQSFSGNLRCELTVGQDDAVMRNLGYAIIAAFEREDEGQSLFLDCALQAVAQHIVGRYGDLLTTQSPGSLALWQERRAKEMIEEKLATGVSLGELAEACRLSTTHFSRAFRQSTGTSPHRWLQERRIEKATYMLASLAPLATIAQACGFADQSHFTRVFTNIVGIGPGQWRRQRCT